MARKKVFISFDYDNDMVLKEFIVEQSKNSDSPFELSDYSLKEAAPESNWLDKARRAIARADVFIIMLGSKTRWASGVLKELKIANEKQKTKFQIIGYKNGTEDWAIQGGGRVYRWNWDKKAAEKESGRRPRQFLRDLIRALLEYRLRDWKGSVENTTAVREWLASELAPFFPSDLLDTSKDKPLENALKAALNE